MFFEKRWMIFSLKLDNLGPREENSRYTNFGQKENRKRRIQNQDITLGKHEQLLKAQPRVDGRVNGKVSEILEMLGKLTETAFCWAQSDWLIVQNQEKAAL